MCLKHYSCFNTTFGISPGLRARWKTQGNSCTAFLGFESGSRIFPCQHSPKEQLLCLPVSAKGEKLGVLSMERVSLTSCTLVPEHRWPQGAWRPPPLQAVRETSIASRAQHGEGPRATLPCCLSHLPKASCNENKQLSIKPVCSRGNDESKHKAAEEPFSGCVLLLPAVTMSPLQWDPFDHKSLLQGVVGPTEK